MPSQYQYSEGQKQYLAKHFAALNEEKKGEEPLPDDWREGLHQAQKDASRIRRGIIVRRDTQESDNVAEVDSKAEEE